MIIPTRCPDGYLVSGGGGGPIELHESTEVKWEDQKRVARDVDQDDLKEQPLMSIIHLESLTYLLPNP